MYSEAAYSNGRARAIARNREIGARRKFAAWIEADPTRIQLQEDLRAASCYGQNGPNFFAKMVEAIQQWGSLSEKQEAAARTILAKAAQEKADKAAARVAANAVVAATSKHVGTVGDRKPMILTLERRLSFDGTYGTTYVHLMKDRAGNVVVHKGSWLSVDVGQTVPVKATIKAHETRDGVAQTIIARPAVGEPIVNGVREVQL